MDIFQLFISAIFVNNIVLAQYLGNCPYLGCSKERGVAFGMGSAVVFVTIMATLFTWLIQTFVLIPFGIEYLQTLAFILVIAALVQFVEMFVAKTVPALYNALGIYLPLITTNCAVLGVTLLNIEKGFNFFEAVWYAFSAAIGFTIAIVLFSGVRERLETADIPENLKGFPIALITASLIAMSFLGFQGLSF